MKISLPDELRQRITDCLTQLDTDLKADATQRSELAGKIAEYEAQMPQVTAQIATLKGLILQDATAADKIPPLQLRLEALTGALTEVRTKLDGMDPVSLWTAKGVLKDVIRHWINVFPDTFADYLSHVFHRQNAINFAKMADARQVLRPVYDRCENLRYATASDLEFVRAVLTRALAGRPYLGQDMPEPKPATDPVPTCAQDETVQTTETHTASTEPAPAMKTQEAALT